MRALVLTAALTGLPSVAFAEDFWVVLGHFDHPPMEWDDGILKQGQELETALAACGLTVFWDFAAKFEGFNADGRGTVFVLSTPDMLDEAKATELLATALPCAPDAHVKAARYFGE
jgi:hypothetical protein